MMELLTPEGQAHAERVADRVPRHTLHRLIALLHDVIEDTEATHLDIERLYGATVADSVRVLTRVPEETYREYILRVLYSDDPYARVIKVADLEDHLDQAATLKPSLKSRYMNALSVLSPGTYALREKKTRSK